MTGITTSMTRTRIALMNLSRVRALRDWPKAWIAEQTDNKDIIGFLLTILAKGAGRHLLPIELLVGRGYHSDAGRTSILRWRSLGGGTDEGRFCGGGIIARI